MYCCHDIDDCCEGMSDGPRIKCVFPCLDLRYTCAGERALVGPPSNVEIRRLSSSSTGESSTPAWRRYCFSFRMRKANVECGFLRASHVSLPKLLGIASQSEMLTDGLLRGRNENVRVSARRLAIPTHMSFRERDHRQRFGLF
jgi:hypothetical protein